MPQYNTYMKSPFPGMDPYLEHPSLWTDVHNRLIAALADVLVPQVAPDYYVRLERRAYLMKPDDIVFIGRPDLSVLSETAPQVATAVAPSNGVKTVELPMTDEVGVDYLEVHEVKTGKLITLIEVLSPSNKVNADGRTQYLQKRAQILRSRTNLIEIDLLRSGEPLPVVGDEFMGDYRILICRGHQRPEAQLRAFGLRKPMPTFPLPLLPNEKEPEVNLNQVFHDLYQRARYDLSLDYTQSPVPPLSGEDAEWAKELIAQI